MPGAGAVFGGIGQGIPQGLQDAQRIQELYQAGQDQASQIALGRTLQMLGAGSPMGGSNMGGIPQAGLPQPPPMAQGSPQGGVPPQQGSGTTMGFNRPSGGPNAPFASRFPSTMPTPQGPVPITAQAPMQAAVPNRQGGMAALQTTMPGGALPPQSQPAQYQPPGQQQPQGWGAQGQPQQGQLDWRQILQAVTAANPGAPPQVIAGAVNRAIPLMNSQAQLEWKQYMAQMAGERVGVAQANTNIRAGYEGQPAPFPSAPGGSTAGGQAGAAVDIAKAIEEGKQPPDESNYRMNPQVNAQLSKDGFNKTEAVLNWKRAQKMVQSLNGPQMTRYMALAGSVQNTIGEAKKLAEELQNSGITPLNRAKIEALINTAGNTPLGQLATRYVTTVNTLKEEFANLAQGGYAPTEAVWALANQQINANYGVQQLQAALDEVNRLVGYRVNAIQSLGGGQVGPLAPNPYTPQQGGGGASGGQGNDPLGIR